MSARRRSLAVIAAFGALALVPVLGAYSDAGTDAQPAASSAASQKTGAATQPDGAVGTLIDVRTPEEFADGHLTGATNIDFTAPDFAERIGRLDKDAEYTLYCRSGRRAGEALELMKDAGFTKVTNAGGLEEAAKSLALDIVE